jgi:hypothetical protein
VAQALVPVAAGPLVAEGELEDVAAVLGDVVNPAQIDAALEGMAAPVLGQVPVML